MEYRAAMNIEPKEKKKKLFHTHKTFRTSAKPLPSLIMLASNLGPVTDTGISRIYVKCQKKQHLN